MTGQAFTLAGLLEGIDGARVRGDAGVAIAEVRDDSRRVGPGDLFVAVPGTVVDGRRFLADAAGQGAAALVIEGEPPAELAFAGTVAAVPNARRALGVIARNRFRAAAELELSAVTGTNGKTTTTYIVEAMLRAAGLSPGVVGTVSYRGPGVPGGARPAPNSTPGALMLHELFAEMRAGGATDVVLEATSHALDQGRVAGCAFRVAAMTNLTQDHLDYHGDMKRYADAKAILFEELIDRTRGVAVTFVDDEAGRTMRGRATAASRASGSRGRRRRTRTWSWRAARWARTGRAPPSRHRWDGWRSRRRWSATTTSRTSPSRSAWRSRAGCPPTRSCAAPPMSPSRVGWRGSPTIAACCAWSTTRTRPTGWSARSRRCARS
jgi:UDP-N-acetylmuramyl-tripeptide synthetase